MKCPLVCGILWILSSSAFASSPVTLEEGNGKYPLGMHLGIFEDREGEFTIEQVSSPQFAPRFIPSQAKVPNYGFSSSVFWVKFVIDPSHFSPAHMLLEINRPNLESIKVYLPRANHDMVIKTGGSLLPFKHREIPYPSHVFAIPIFSQNLQTVYVRFQSLKPMLMPLILWEENAFWAHSNTRQILNGLVYGSTLIMIIYNLFLFISLRDKAYFFYALYILSFLFVLLSIDGNAFRYLWPENPEWANVCVLYFIFSYAIITLFFTGSFLNIPINFPKFNKWLVLSIGLSILGLIIHMIAPSFKKHTIFIGVFDSIFMLSVSIIALKKGYIEVRFFLIARMISVATFLSFGLMNVGIFPDIQRS